MRNIVRLFLLLFATLFAGGAYAQLGVYEYNKEVAAPSFAKKGFCSAGNETVQIADLTETLADLNITAEEFAADYELVDQIVYEGVTYKLGC